MNADGGDVRELSAAMCTKAMECGGIAAIVAVRCAICDAEFFTLCSLDEAISLRDGNGRARCVAESCKVFTANARFYHAANDPPEEPEE